jgi:hypothetical protein
MVFSWRSGLHAFKKGPGLFLPANFGFYVHDSPITVDTNNCSTTPADDVINIPLAYLLTKAKHGTNICNVWLLSYVIISGDKYN